MDLLAAEMAVARSWFLLPLVVIISLVYSASRYESPDRIVKRAVKVCLQILGFMGAVLLVILAFSWGL